jgi:hypothetical protein
MIPAQVVEQRISLIAPSSTDRDRLAYEAAVIARLQMRNDAAIGPGD